MKRIAKLNKIKNYSPDNDESVVKMLKCQKIENETNSDLKDASSQTNCSKIFCSWKSLIKIFALFILFISINLNYFSIAIGITTVIQINPYLMYLLSSCFEFVGVILCHVNDIIGRRKVNFLILFFNYTNT